MASLVVHALLALLLFSIATSSSEQQAPESTQGAEIVSVSSESPHRAVASKPRPIEVPRPNAPRARRASASVPRSAPAHPRVVHELAKFAPTAPPNPTPAPQASSVPNPQTTQPQLAVSPLPLPAAVPTSVPRAPVAVSVRIPPTAAPSPQPSRAPRTKAAAPRATASPAPIRTSPRPRPTPGLPSPGPARTAAPAAPVRGTAPSPGPKPVGSPGPRGIAPVKTAAIPRPIQAQPTPRPAAARPAPHPPVARTRPGLAGLNARLHSLIPTSPPATPSSKFYAGDLNAARPGTENEPTPPPNVLAATKYLFEENPGKAGDEYRVKMYVTATKRLGPVTICTGWLLRYAPAAPHGTYRLDSNYDPAPKPIVEPNVTLLCAGRLTPFVPSPSPSP